MAELGAKLGSQIVAALKEMDKVADRRPLLALAADNSSKKVMEQVIEKQMSSREFNNIKLHAKWPGALIPVLKTKVFRNRIDPAILQRLHEFFDDPRSIQRYAFGTHVLDLFGGFETTAISSVDRLEKLPKLAARFIMSLDEELQHVGELPPDQFRCRI